MGTTDDVQKRLKEHNTGLYHNAFTSKGIPWNLITSIECQSSNEAYTLEKFIKRMKSSKFTQKFASSIELQHEILQKKIRSNTQ